MIVLSISAHSLKVSLRHDLVLRKCNSFLSLNISLIRVALKIT